LPPPATLRDRIIIETRPEHLLETLRHGTVYRSYRDSLKLLLQFAARPKRRVADLTVLDLTPAKIIAFLDHLEAQRGNDATTRNVRLSAIHSFFDYLGAQWPEHLDQARRVLAITFKRTTHRAIDYLEAEEVRTILEQIDQRTVWGRRDYALLALLFNTGARVSESSRSKRATCA
jgi:site-specific recombinase XerD